ncbi:hypothetical protein CLV44_10374 [Marinobacterium halophilum]|uniref:O-antigen ligase-like membrane protein n=1 Tax=Marinobacterium halophilum TaxID=267374 RepID=A0A2P8F252_9GAMM|nr:hypothetical protein [Marinobacterium halophilum]PSL15793.1 hypothetical protein CLV44_10374 [Marinobacterium halophilum]
MTIEFKKIGGFFLCVAMLLFFISETLLAIGNPFSFQMKIIATVLSVIAFTTSRKVSVELVIIPVIFIFFIMNYFRADREAAAIEELFRFLLPMLVLMALYSNKGVIDSISKLFIWVVISNNVYQIYVYMAYYFGFPVLIPIRFEAGSIIRAEGWVGFFSLYGFMNFCALMLVRYAGIYENHKKMLSFVFFIFAVLSTSLKLLAAFIIYAAFNMKKKSAPLVAIFLIAAIAVFAHTQKNLIGTMLSAIDSKFAFYITQGNSARSDSYRVMFESLVKPNLIGEGLGMFGGPASVKYGSPLYREYNFNWHNTATLSTTDTFYPHLFVELGLLGGITYLFFIFRYGQKNITKPWVIIVTSFLIDAAFSFSILSIPYFLSAAICMLIFSEGKNVNNKKVPL